jgi:hypothetical protein
MINENCDMGEALTIAAGGFESTTHPTWTIQKKIVDPIGLVPPIWTDAWNYYDEFAVYRDGLIDLGSMDYPVQYRPEELRKILEILRERHKGTDTEFRMVIRVEMEKALDF